ncbi:aldo/keto reductase [Microbacterium hominis]|uniref:Aldo/keto reductase n=1 Tax=Microbacterium hominis TaxID=162426 RepID=A0A7D4UH90_9MICO|nr:aldo/keto reductase [Microbacterium hominis]QKJ20629.1 aldo/keto reductase [Microbacterium hominis]
MKPPVVNPSPLTLGMSGLGEGTAPGSEGEAAAVADVVALLESPHAYLDTSNNYAGGRSEAVIGLALAQAGGDAASRVITKVDVDPVTGAFDRDRVLRSFEESASRLGVDRLPLLHFHDPYAVSVAEAMAPGGAVDGLRELRDAGVVGAIGIATYPVDEMLEYVGTGVFDAVLSHNRYTLLDQSAAPLFGEARRRGMTVFNAAPFASGILVKGASATYVYREPEPEIVERVHRLEEICRAHGVALPAVALQFSLRSDLIDSTVVGVKTADRLAGVDAFATAVVPEEVWAAIDALGGSE